MAPNDFLDGLPRAVETRSRKTVRVSRIANEIANDCFPKQRTFVVDDSTLVAACVARESGKTTGGVKRIARGALLNGTRNVFIGLSRDSAVALALDSEGGIRALCEHYKIRARFNETTKNVRFLDTGSEIWVRGADDKKEIEKLRGFDFQEIVLDEVASQNRTLVDHLIKRVIGPRLKGSIAMIGTPGHILSGTFYDVTRVGSTEGGWSVHRWGRKDNIYRPGLWEQGLRMKELNGWTDANPVWRREYLGEWAADDTGYVYRIRPYLDDGSVFNLWRPIGRSRVNELSPDRGNPFGLPAEHKWEYVYGLDLGWAQKGSKKDRMALQILAFSPTSRELLQVYERVGNRIQFEELGELIQSMIRLTGYPVGMVADLAGYGGDFVERLNAKFALNLEAAEKKNKNDVIALMNGDLVDGRFKCIEGSQLQQEMQTLQWAEDGIKENEQQANDCCDAAVYAARRAFHHWHRAPEPPKPSPGSAAAIAAALDEDEDRLARVRTPEDELFGNPGETYDHLFGDWRDTF